MTDEVPITSIASEEGRDFLSLLLTSAFRSEVECHLKNLKWYKLTNKIRDHSLSSRILIPSLSSSGRTLHSVLALMGPDIQIPSLSLSGRT